MPGDLDQHAARRVAAGLGNAALAVLCARRVFALNETDVGHQPTWMLATNLNINFLRKPSANAAIIGESRLLKLGKSLAVGEVSLFSEGSEEPVAHVVGTYSIPPSARESGK